MWSKLAVLLIPVVALAATAEGSYRRTAAAAADCWCCTCQGGGCNCHTCVVGGTTCDNRGGAGCDVTGTCPISFMDDFADGSALRADVALEGGDDDVAQSEAPMVRAVERLKLKAGWLVARDCGGLIVRRHIEPDGATAALDRTSTITLN